MRQIDLSTVPKRFWSWRMGLVIAIPLMLFAVAYSFIPSEPIVQSNELWVEKVKKGELTVSLRGSGELFPLDVLTLSAENGGSVEKLVAKPGDKLGAGDIVAVLSNPQLQQKLIAAETQLAEKQASVKQAEASLAIQKLEHEAKTEELAMRLSAEEMELDAHRKLLANHIVSRIQFEKLELVVKSLHTQLQQAKQRNEKFDIALKASKDALRVSERRATDEVLILRRQRDQLIIKAPSAGVLMEYADSLAEGSLLNSGSLVSKLATSNKLVAEVRVPASRVAELERGQRVTVDLRNSKVQGVVERIDARVTADQVKVTIGFETNLAKDVRPGLPVIAEIETSKMANAIYVTRPVGVEPSKDTTIFVVNLRANRLQRTKAKFGAVGGAYILVEQGLSEGDLVVLSDMSKYQAESELILNQSNPNMLSTN